MSGGEQPPMFAYILNLATLICINAILAITLNFVMGYAGIFSVAHAIFFGVGAYTAAQVALHFDASLFVAVPAAMAVAAALSLALALPALRVRGEYFVAASLGLQVIGVTIFSEWKTATGGIGGVLLIAMVIIRGTGTRFVPVVGAALLMILPGLLSYLGFLPPTEIGAIQQIIYGLAMVLLMIFRPGGLVGGAKT